MAGGLHVIVVNLPARSRTLMQNVGRCSRQGQPGSATVYVSPEDQFQEGYNFTPGTLNRFKLEEMFYGYVKANWPELMQVDRKYYSGAMYYFGATVEDIFKANERVIARRFFWPGKKLAEEECQRYLNMVYQMLLTAWGRMFTDLSMSPDQNDWGKCQKAYNEFIAKIEAWRPRDEKGKPLGLGQFIKVFAQRTGLGEIIYHQLYEDWHEDETIEDFIYRLLDDYWTWYHMNNAGIDTRTRNITPEKLKFLPQKHQDAYEKLQKVRAEYKKAMAKYESDLEVYKETLKENARRKARNAANAEERARIRDEIGRNQNESEEAKRAARERADAEQAQINSDYQNWKESQESHGSLFSTTVYADEGPNSQRGAPVTREEVEEIERKAREIKGKIPPGYLEATEYHADPGNAFGDTEELAALWLVVQDYYKIKAIAESMRAMLNDSENAEKRCQEASDAITESSLQTIEELRKRGESIKDQDLLIVGNKPVEPKKPDYTKIGREDFCDLDIDSLIWALYGDPQKYLDEFHRKYLPKIESSYGGHLPKEYVNYLDKQLLDAMKQTARDIQNDRRERARKEKALERTYRICAGLEGLVNDVANLALWMIPVGREIKAAKAGMTFVKALKMGAGVFESACELSQVGEDLHNIKSGITGEDLEEPSSNFMRDVVFGRNENLYNITRSTVGLGYLGLELTPSISRRVSSWWKAKQAAGESMKRIEEGTGATERAAAEGMAEESAAARGKAKLGKLVGSLEDKTLDERKMISDLLEQGKTVEILPESTRQGVRMPDFKVDGILTELKTLNGESLNTPISKIQKGFSQGAQTVIVDARKTKLTLEQAKGVLSRVAGVYEGKLPGNIEIWTNEGVLEN